MATTSNEHEIHAVRVVHEYLQPDERVLLFGRCGRKKCISKRMFLILLLLLPLSSLLFYIIGPLLPPQAQFVALGIFFAPVALLILAVINSGRPVGFCALTDRRLIQWGDEGILSIASRNEVRQIAGLNNKVTLIIEKENDSASHKDSRLGKSKIVQRIELSPLRRFAEIVGGEELLLDTTSGDA